MKRLYKLITGPLVIIFLSQNIGWAAPNISPQSIVHSPQPIYIPEQYGRIDKSAYTKSPQVILIKDAHCNYEAQTNISKILDILIRDYKIDLIGAEGASGYVNPSIVLESNPKEDIRKKVSDKFLRTGLLTASEALSINKGKDPGFTIWGVEDLKLYLRDFQAFRDSIGINNSAKHFIELLFNLIGQLKKKIYPEELLEFDDMIKKYQSNELPLTRFIKILYYKYSIPKQHQNLKIVLKSIRLEEKIDFKKVEYERGQLIRQLEKTLPKEDLQELVTKSLLFKLGKIPAVEYYTYLNGQTINLKNYTRLVKLQSRIDESHLFNELEDLAEKIYAKLCKDKISHNLHLLDKDINILNKILSLEATREALTYFKENYARFTPENLLRFIRIQAPLNNINLPTEISSPSFIEDAEKAIIPAEEFYRLAIERDNALVENLVQTMDKNKKDKAVLICGGFHADGIKKLLQDKGISPITITPSITKIQEDSKELYLKRMLDKRIDPEKMLEELGLENLQALLATTLIPLTKEVKTEIEKLSPGIELKDAYTPEELLRLWDSLPEAKNDPSLESLKSFFEKAGRENAQHIPPQQPLVTGGETLAKAPRSDSKSGTLHMESMKLRKGSKYYADRLQINSQDVDINGIKEQISTITNWMPAPGLEEVADNEGFTVVGAATIKVNGKLITIYKLTSKGKSFYITSKIITGFGSENFPNIIDNALSTLQSEGKNLTALPDDICIFNLSGSPHLFEDHTRNGFIGINQFLIDLYKDQPPQQSDLLSSLLQIGLEHELLHELGETDETILKERDIKRINQLLKYPKDIRQLFQIIENAVEIDHDFKAGVIAELAERYCRSNSLPRLNLKDIINKPLPNGEGTQRRIMEYLIRFFDCGFLLILNLNGLLRNQGASEEVIGITLEGIMKALGKITLRETDEFVIPLKIKYDPNWEAQGTTAWKRREEILTIPEDITVNVNVTESFNPINTFLHELAHYRWYEMQLPGKSEFEARLEKFLEEIGLERLYSTLDIHELVAYTAASGDIGDFIQTFLKNKIIDLNSLPYKNFEAGVTKLLKIHLFRNTAHHPGYPGLFSYEWPRCQNNSAEIQIKKGWLRQEDDTWHELMDEELLLTLSQNISTENGKALAKTLAEKVILSEKFADIEKLFNTIETLEEKDKCYYSILTLIQTPGPRYVQDIVLDIGLLAKIAERSKADAYKAYAALSGLIRDVSDKDENIRNIVLDISLLTAIAENSTNIAYSYSYLNRLTEKVDKAPPLPDWFTLDLLMNIAKQGNSREYFSCLVENRGDLQDYWLAEGVLGYLQEKMSGTATSAATTLKAPGSKGLDKQGGSDSMDEDRRERRYIERLIRRKKKKLSKEEQLGITKAIKSAIGLIPDEKPVQSRIEIHKLSLGDQLGIPRFKGAKSAKDLIYAYVKVKERKTPDGQKEKVLHIYVTEAFWRVLGKNPRMLAFLLDHEWQENMLPTPKSHAEASKGAWRFTDLDGMNPFYKFFIEQLAREEEIDYLVKLASQKHENDPGDRFRKYVINAILGIRNVEEVKQLREELTATVGRPPEILNISYTSAPGSGVAEVLRNVQKTSKDFGLNTSWAESLVLKNQAEFSEITAKIHHAIQGDRFVKITDDEWKIYDGVNSAIAQRLANGLENSDVIVLHDHHHLGLVPEIKRAKPNIKIIWWCHLDVSSPNLKVWEHLKGYIDEVDLVVFQQRDNVKDVYNRLDIKPPSVFAPPAIIYPTSLIHRSLDNLGDELVSSVLAQHKDKKISVPEAEEAEESEDAFIRMVLGLHNIDPNRPILLGAGRYDPDKNIEGAIDAFVQAWKQSPQDKKPQFVYAGAILTGDAEGETVYKDLKNYITTLPSEIARDIHLLKLPKDRITASLEINALQRAAYIGLQLSRKEGFGLPVAELMWKGKPVIGMNTGGIATQIKDTETGYLVNKSEEAADRILQLLKDPKEVEDMGRRARDYVKNNFLITHMIRNYELLIMSLFNKSIGEWLEYNRAVSIYDLNTHIGETLTMGRVQQFYKILLGQKGEFKNASSREEKNSKATQISQTLERARILHHAIEDMLTDGGMAGQLVSEKLLNMFWEQLKTGKTKKKIDFACITLPIGPLNKDRGYDRANKFKKIFYQKVQDYIRRNKPDAFVQYEEIPGAYYGISGTRLYVIGLNEEDLDKIIKEIFPLCLGEIGVPEDETKNYEMYAGHITASLKSSEQWKEIQHETDKKEITRLFEKYIQYCKIQATGRADVIEKEIRRGKKVVLGESDEGLLKDHEEDIEKYGNLNTIPEAEYAPQAPDRDGLVPRFSHMMGYIYLAYEDLKNELSDGTNIDTKVTKYLFTLNMRFLESLLDSRYKGVFKKQFFNIILEGIKNGTLSEYIKYLKSFLEDEKTKEAISREIIFPKEVEYMKELISYFESPLKITKMGDEIWLYIETSKGIIQCFGELDNFNAFNSAFPSPPEDNRDSIYHQILAEIHNLYTQFCTENGYEEKLNRGQIKKFAKYLKKKFLGIIITIPQGTPYDDGYTIKTQPAIIKGKDGKQIGEIESIDLLTVKPGQRIRLKDMPFHYKDKLRIDGAIHRLYLYEAKKRGSQPRRIAIYDNRIFTADGKGEEDEHDITEEIMSEGWELSPLYCHTGIAFTTDLHGLTDMDPDRISNINTFQKKHMDNKYKVWDIKDDIAEQIVSTLREKGIKGIDPDTIADAIVEAKEGKIKIDFMVLWDSVKGRIDDPKEFFEIAVSISKPINTLLGPAARDRGARFMSCILMAILENLPEDKRKEILNKPNVTDEERLLELIKTIAKEKGIDPNAMQSIFDLFKGGKEILSADPGLDIGKIDGSYFTLISEMERLTGISGGKIINAFKRHFGIGDVRQSQGEIIEDTLLYREAKRLEEYNRQTSGNYPLEQIDKKLWNSDFGRGAILKDLGKNDKSWYLSGLDAVSKDVKNMVNALSNTKAKPIIEDPTPVGIVFDIDKYIIENEDGTFSYNPALASVLNNPNIGKGIMIGFRVSEGKTEGDKQRLERKITFLKTAGILGEGVLILPKDISSAQEIMMGRTNLQQNQIVFAVGNTEVIPEELQTQIKDNKLKVIVLDEDTSLHAALVFAVLYARFGNIFENNKLTDTARDIIRTSLSKWNIRDEEIKDLLSELETTGFFILKLIRIADTLKEFQNRKIFIDVAA